MPRQAITISAGGAVGLVIFSLTLGLQLVHPQNVQWLLYGGDARIHFLGWHLFRNESWGIPLGQTHSFGFPVGTSVGNTDSIPVMAFIFKLFHPFLPIDFQYIGLWLLIGFMLQGAFGALLVRTISSNVLVQTFGGALFVLAPVLMNRVGHMALTAHWLVLASLWLYFAWPRHLTNSQAFAACTLVCMIAAAVHPYLTMMVVSVVTAFYFRCAIAGGRIPTIVSSVARLIVLATLVLLIWWQAGYFVVGNTTDIVGAGFGGLGMNVLAPIMPLGVSQLLAPLNGLASPHTAQTHEGYAYLGAGVLLLLAIALIRVMSIRKAPLIAKQHWQHLPFVLACIMLTVLALSNTVMVGTWTVLQYNEAWLGPFTTFRASGRLFWPVLYTLVFVAIAGSIAGLPARRAAILLGLAVIVQGVDLDAYRSVRGIRHLSWDNPLKSDFWLTVAGHYKHLTLVPSNMCSREALDYTPFAFLAGRLGLTINAGAAARYDSKRLAAYCDQFVENTVKGSVSQSELYVMTGEQAERFQMRATDAVTCMPIDGYQACFATTSYTEWQNEFDLVRSQLPTAPDFAKLYSDLDAAYRDNLHRPARPVHATTGDKSEALVKYLAYRLWGCEHHEAQSKVLNEIRAYRELRLCSRHARTRIFPPLDETFEFSLQAEQLFRDTRAIPVAVTHVDVEGEAVWLQHYAEGRLLGRTHQDSRDSVLRSILRLTSAPVP